MKELVTLQVEGVQRIQELGVTGAADPEVFRKAQELKAILVTDEAHPLSRAGGGPAAGGLYNRGLRGVHEGPGGP